MPQLPGESDKDCIERLCKQAEESIANLYKLREEGSFSSFKREARPFIRMFPAGTYYIGDPCYAFDESWGKILDDNNFFEKHDQQINGVAVLCGSTAYGDGTYKDQFGNEYPVDAGLIGILPVELLDIDKVIRSHCGRVWIFPEAFEVYIHKGRFSFGHVAIDTKGDEEDDLENYGIDDYDNI